MKKILIPLVLLITGSTSYAQSKKKKPPPPPEVAITKFKPPIIIAKGEKAEDFYKRNPDVKEIWRQGNLIELKMKDGTKQEYNVDKNEDMKSFTDKYGESPLPPPPPPPKKPSKA